MQGAPPLASPGLNRRGHRSRGANHAPSGGLSSAARGRGCWRCARGACLFGRLLTLPFRNPQGGLPFWSPAIPAFSFISCPHPPARARRALFPSGEGGDYSYLMQGAPPLASPGLNLRFAAKTIGSGSLLAVPAAKERGDRGRWNYPSHATAAFEMVLSPGAGRASAAGNARAQAVNHHGFITKCSKSPAPQIPVAGRINKLCR